jgi:hypothetical protein
MKPESEIRTIETVSCDQLGSRNPMSVVVVDDPERLEDYVQAWDELAEEAIEANPFYEWWMLIPALRGLATGKDVRVVLVISVEAGLPLLCGVFPVERKKRYKRLPVATFSLWQHIYCALCTPLIRSGYARECLDAFLDWLATECGGPLMEFNLVPGDGPFYELLTERLLERGNSSLVSESYERAVFRRRRTLDEYLNVAISSRHRRDMRRKLRRLSERGRIAFDELDVEADAERWIEEFLSLEASSWKGKEGGAFACSEEHRNYFVTIAKEAFSRGRLMMSAMRLEGKPVAQKFSLLAGCASFALKISYDESYAYFSPGMLLEVENIGSLHRRPDIEWMDSCAAPIHFINRIWPDRRKIQTLLVSTGGTSARLMISLLPFLRTLNRALRAFPRGQSTQKENQQ